MKCLPSHRARGDDAKTEAQVGLPRASAYNFYRGFQQQREGQQQPSLCWSCAHGRADRCAHSLTLLPVFLSTFYLPLRTRYTHPSPRKPSLISLRMVSLPLHFTAYSPTPCGGSCLLLTGSLTTRGHDLCFSFISENPRVYRAPSSPFSFSTCNTDQESARWRRPFRFINQGTEAAGGAMPARLRPHWADYKVLFSGPGFAMQIPYKGRAVRDSKYIFPGLSCLR